MATQLREDGRRAAARGTVEAADVVEAAHRDRTGRDAGGGDGRPGAMEGAPSRRLAAPRTVGRAGGRDARSIDDVDADPPQPGARPARPAAGAGGARSRLRR